MSGLLPVSVICCCFTPTSECCWVEGPILIVSACHAFISIPNYGAMNAQMQKCKF